MNVRAKGTDRLLDVLEFVMHQQPNTRNAIAAELGAPRSTIYSVIDTLLARGFVDQFEPDGLIVPGRRCGLLGLAYDRSAPLIRQAREVISDLATATGEVVELDVLQDWKQLILVSRSGRGHNYRGVAEGTRIPLPRTASGRFLLEDYTLAELQRSIPPVDFMMPAGDSSTAEVLHAEIAQARNQGYWITRGLVDPYVACITAPVRALNARCLGVVCLVMPLPELGSREQACIDLTCKAAAKLTEACALLRNPSF